MPQSWSGDTTQIVLIQHLRSACHASWARCIFWSTRNHLRAISCREEETTGNKNRTRWVRFPSAVCRPTNPSRTLILYHWSTVSNYYTPAQRSCCWGVYWFHSFRPSVRPSVPHPVSTLWRLQFWLDPFHISTSYQATSKGVSHVKLLEKFKNWIFGNF